MKRHYSRWKRVLSLVMVFTLVFSFGLTMQASAAGWLARLFGLNGSDGRDGKDGANGASAYELAVENVFKGQLGNS